MGKTVFSGIQPTGVVHIGNYLGAIRNWAQMLNDYNCIFCVVDLHAMTVDYAPDEMQEKIRETVMVNMAAGLDPARCTLFVQSHVPEHTELTWVLSTCAAYGELSRMTQFKEKSEQHRENVNAGLFTYPILMAADILLYKATVVPVGEDQTQHLEFAREVCRAFNRRYGETFPEPQPKFSRVTRLMGLEGKNKMSKSLNNYIPVLAEPDEIREMLRTAATDPARIRRDDPGNPEVCNIHTMHLGFSSDEDVAWCEKGCRTAGIGCVECKKRLAENMIQELEPVRQKYREYQNDPDFVDDVIATGASKCKEQAEQTMAEVRQKTGIR
ncbi:MAG: tryptophan--tRNA ligase [Candidatus Brocadiia bacterium]